MICSDCPAETMQAKDGLCKGCRLRAATKRRQKYHWTPELDARLRRCYQAKNKTALGIEIAEFVRRTGFKRHIVQNRAQKLGLRLWTCERWEPEDIAALREMAGEMRPYKIAQLMGRSEFSVCNKLWMLGLARHMPDGFSRNELSQLMGVHHIKIERWIQRRWLSLNDEDRIPYATVARFLWDHMEEYRFAACEEWWLKTMLKPPSVKHVLATNSDGRRRREEAA